MPRNNHFLDAAKVKANKKAPVISLKTILAKDPASLSSEERVYLHNFSVRMANPPLVQKYKIYPSKQVRL